MNRSLQRRDGVLRKIQQQPGTDYENARQLLCHYVELRKRPYVVNTRHSRYKRNCYYPQYQVYDTVQGEVL